MGSILTGSDAATLSVGYADDDNEALTSHVGGRGHQPKLHRPGRHGRGYYYAAVLQADGDRLVTSPIWYTRGAVALAPAPAGAKLPLDVYPTRNTATRSYYLPAATSISAEVFDEVGCSVMTLAREQRQVAGLQTLAVPARGPLPRAPVARRGERVS